MRDAHYTEPEIAWELVSAFGTRTPARVADFACGDGALLQSASEKWPSSTLVGVDIAADVEEQFKSRVPRARFINADFFELPEPSVLGLFDAILLNPPFSCRGATTEFQQLGGRAIRCSRALSFVVRSLRYLRPTGSLLAILPSSCLHSDKDARVRSALEKLFEIDVVPTAQAIRFRRCSVSTTIVRLRKRQVPALSSATSPAIDEVDFRIMRGGAPNKRRDGSRDFPPFVHTSELKSNSVMLDRRADADPRDRLIVGPAILLPRVGRPREDKLCLLPRGERVRISDCIVAITHNDESEITAAFQAMKADWENLRLLYAGTCASYLTLTRVRNYLATLHRRTAKSAAA